MRRCPFLLRTHATLTNDLILWEEFGLKLRKTILSFLRNCAVGDFGMARVFFYILLERMLRGLIGKAVSLHRRIQSKTENMVRAKMKI